MTGDWKEFAPYLKAQARGPTHLGELDAGTSEEAMGLILRGVASDAQIAGFLLVGRARTESATELAAYARAMHSLVRHVKVSGGTPVVSITGGFDGKVRTLNVGAAASLVAAAAGGRVMMLAGEDVPPKYGRTVIDALRNLGASLPRNLKETTDSLGEYGFAVTTPEHYLPELHTLLQLRREMVRRTALNVVEKIISPVPGSKLMIGITHRPFLRTIPDALRSLGVASALVYQAIEGSDEAPLDSASSLVRTRGAETEELRVPPGSLGLSRATKANIPWKGPEDEYRRLNAALSGEEGPVKDLILYNAALRLWVARDDVPLPDCLEVAQRALESGAALELAGWLFEPSPATV